MKAKEYERWTKVRSMGEMKFILVYGVLLFGLVMFGSLFLSSIESLDFYDVLVRLLITSACGYFCGSIIWMVQDSRYKKTND